jgi:hypothetical protein
MTPVLAIQPGCHYYGKSHIVYQRSGQLVDQHGNECALVYTSYSPCQMETRSYPVCEDLCPIAAAHRWEGRS